MAAARSSCPAGARRGPAALRRRERGGAALGFIVGLIVGLAIAVAVALFVTRAPVPFVNKAYRPAERVLEPKPGAELPDPNKPLQAKTRPVPPVEPPPEAPSSAEERASILDRLFGRGAAESAGLPAPRAAPAPEPAVPAGTGAAKGDTKSDTKGEARPADARPSADAPERTTYLLQAGAFRSPEDADAMRGRLALLGFEGRVQPAEVNGQTVYRVRVGPYAHLDDINKARARLAESGIEASVVRQK